MINLFDTYDQNSWDLHYSLLMAGYQNTTVALNDDGFLPEDVTSPYQFFTGFDQETEGRPLYFNEVPVPDFWEIAGNNNQAEILDYDQKRGEIHYSQPTHKRLVKTVDWYDREGRLRVTDRYHRSGKLFGQTTYNEQGQAIFTSYLAPDQVEVLVENHVTGDLTLNWEQKVYIFKTKHEFVRFYLNVSGLDTDRIFFNSLGLPFLATYYLEESGQDILFWQEPIGDEIPGNMQILLNGSPRPTKIIVQDYAAYEKLRALATAEQQSQIDFLGFIYPFVRRNQGQANALILTNSDQLEHIDTLVTQLPDLHFHIGALTEMSSRLMDLAKYDNVSLYPNISQTAVDHLAKTCDYYLDINHFGEILSAVRMAFENHMLITAFTNTRHNAAYTAQGLTFAPEQVADMVALLQSALHQAQDRSHYLSLQEQHAHVETTERYRALIG
ncbi:accessory Sec system glycosylation chaperone GtfB [Streptococcus sp. DD12]|uniref:accessory Sec system glycosylation chaperone GtfB n=1 Tax=Streptococcus sp. DD12 TaxID=1777880 RepID=UPI0007938D59|nr:accessory Sec system glycosylation chaperone GtfB [Streptococcus sp. DD12]KXT76152.1 GftB: Glycosyl transferase, family 8 [Streptococcus sp. DD12]